MSVHSPAALARNVACSIQTISSRSLPRTVTARPRLTRSAKRARIIPELYPGRADQQQVAVVGGGGAAGWTREVASSLYTFRSPFDAEEKSLEG
jgi:hypothetical protein